MFTVSFFKFCIFAASSHRQLKTFCIVIFKLCTTEMFMWLKVISDYQPKYY
uniref:Uncharacterized protein n=1 Tax=Anguilla anguilla TaxID=7936 RepID=A0A0E9RTD4_ANGAN